MSVRPRAYLQLIGGGLHLFMYGLRKLPAGMLRVG